MKSVVTSDNSTNEQENAKEDVPGFSPKVINDLSLANGENYSKNLAQDKRDIKEKLNKIQLFTSSKIFCLSPMFSTVIKHTINSVSQPI